MLLLILLNFLNCRIYYLIISPVFIKFIEYYVPGAIRGAWEIPTNKNILKTPSLMDLIAWSGERDDKQ